MCPLLLDKFWPWTSEFKCFFCNYSIKNQKKDLSELSKAGFAIALYSHALIKCLPIVLTVQSLSHKCLVYWTLYSNT